MPLLSIIEDPEARRDLQELARRYNREVIADRGMDMEAQILEIIRDMLASPYGEQRLPLKDITSWFVDRHGTDYERKGDKQMDRDGHSEAAESEDAEKPRSLRDTAFGAAEAGPAL